MKISFEIPSNKEIEEQKDSIKDVYVEENKITNYKNPISLHYISFIKAFFLKGSFSNCLILGGDLLNLCMNVNCKKDRFDREIIPLSITYNQQEEKLWKKIFSKYSNDIRVYNWNLFSSINYNNKSRGFDLIYLDTTTFYPTNHDLCFIISMLKDDGVILFGDMNNKIKAKMIEEKAQEYNLFMLSLKYILPPDDKGRFMELGIFATI